MTNKDLKNAAELSFLTYSDEHIVSFDNGFKVKKITEKPLVGLSSATPDQNKIKVVIAENADSVIIGFRGSKT